MANAKKCDRCGAYYDPKEELGEVYGVTLNYGSEYNNETYDLCDDCVAKIREFLNSAGEGEEN